MNRSIPVRASPGSRGRCPLSCAEGRGFRTSNWCGGASRGRRRRSGACTKDTAGRFTAPCAGSWPIPRKRGMRPRRRFSRCTAPWRGESRKSGIRILGPQGRDEPGHRPLAQPAAQERPAVYGNVRPSGGGCPILPGRDASGRPDPGMPGARASVATLSRAIAATAGKVCRITLLRRIEAARDRRARRVPAGDGQERPLPGDAGDPA